MTRCRSGWRTCPRAPPGPGVTIPTLDTAELADGGPFDAVLCDVPCSGTGTWRRDPEAKWRLTPARLAELRRRVQSAILDAAAPFVAPGVSWST
jgi:16S rRNA (cytosine967-C5)-methyltransferase